MKEVWKIVRKSTPIYEAVMRKLRHDSLTAPIEYEEPPVRESHYELGYLNGWPTERLVVNGNVIDTRPVSMEYLNG